MRCSPIVCAADNLGMIIHLTLLICSGFGPRKAAHVVLMERGIESGVCESSGEGLQSVEKTGAVRALLFCLGTLPQIVKLMALSGIPWTKAWAGMYLGSLLIIELLALVAEKQDEDAQTASTRYNSSLFRYLSTIKRVLGISSIAIHLLWGIWAYQQILSKPINLPDEDDFEDPLFYPSYFWKLCFVSIMFSLLSVVVACLLFIPSAKFGNIGSLVCYGTFTFICITTTVFVVSNFTQIVFSPISPLDSLDCYYGMVITRYFLLFMLFGSIWVSIILLSWPSKHIQSHVLFLEPDSLDPSKDCGRLALTSSVIRFSTRSGHLFESVAACAFFVGTFILSIAWYSICYEHIGTHKPEWANFLG